MRFEWDVVKERANVRKHGVNFKTASEVFTASKSSEAEFDDAHSDDEERWKIIGPTTRGLLLVVFAFRMEDVIWIISARHATKHEQRRFHER
jgi:uncharacterized DUF497 family protein